MLLLIIAVEVIAVFALGFAVAAWSQGTWRVRDWTSSSPYPRRNVDLPTDNP